MSLLKIILIFAHAFFIKTIFIDGISNSTKEMEDEDIQKGNSFRQQEFNNQNENDYQRNIDLINEKRHMHSDWTVESSCRVNSGKFAIDHCMIGSPNRTCFSARINYNYTDQSVIFGQFPHQLEYLRHFPRCWLRLAPFICLGNFRPCVISTKHNVGSHLYVLLQQFPISSCLNMLDHCAFVVPHLLQHFSGYLDCYANYNANRNRTESDSKKHAMYKQDCKVNYINEYAELATLANDSFQCLWPLVKSIDDARGEEGENHVHASPLIDGCYLPCQSPIFPTESLWTYNFFCALWYFFIAVLNILTACAVISKHRRQLPIALCAMIILTFFSMSIAAIGMAISTLRLPQDRILGEFATCIENGYGGQIRRYPNGFKLPEGKENSSCAIQAFIVNFSTIFMDSSCFLILVKLIFLPCLPRLFHNFLPKWDSSILPISLLFYSLFIALFNIFFDEVSIDPVNGLCHFSFHGRNLITPKTFCYALITLVVAALIYYINWIRNWKKIQFLRKNCYNINGFNGVNKRANGLKINSYFEDQQNLFDQHNYPDRQHMIEENDGYLLSIQSNKGENDEENEHKSKSNQDKEEEEDANEQMHDDRQEERTPFRVIVDTDTNQSNYQIPAVQKTRTSRDWLHYCRLNALKDYHSCFLKFIHRHLRSIFILWLLLLVMGLLFAQKIINPEEEIQLILKSINCSTNRVLSERISLDWINQKGYHHNLETNPHIRKRFLGQNTSARYCELELQSLHFYWINTILNGLNFLLISAIISVLTSFTEYLRVEREIEVKEEAKVEVEMLEMRMKHGSRGRPFLDETGGYDSTNEQSSNSNDYARISAYDAEASVTSTMIPASTLQPTDQGMRNSEKPLNIIGQPPESRPPYTKPPAISNNNITHNIGGNNDQTEEDKCPIYSPTESDLSSFYFSSLSLPPFGHLQQGQHCAHHYNGSCLFPHANSTTLAALYEQITAAAAFLSPEKCLIETGRDKTKEAEKEAEIREAKTATWVQQNRGNPLNSIASVWTDPNTGRMRKRVGSEPTLDYTTKMDGKPARREDLKKTKRDRRHKLYIQGPPKELQREWQREERRGKVRRRRASGSIGLRQSAAENNYDDGLTAIYNGKYIPGDLSAPNVQLTAINQLQLPSSNYCNPNWTCHQQHGCCHIFPVFVPVPSTSAASNTTIPTHSQNPLLVWQPSSEQQPFLETGNLPQCEQQQQSSFESNDYSDEGEEEREEIGDDNEFENAKDVPSTTSLEPSSSSIPSSEKEEDERNSNDFDSDSPDSFEEKRWEELIRQTSTTSAGNS